MKATLISALGLMLPALWSTPYVAQKTPDTRINTAVPALSTSSDALDLATTGSSVYAVWTDFSAGSLGVYFNKSTNAGESWLPGGQVRIDNNHPLYTGSSRQLQVAAAGNNVYAAWHSTSQDIYANYSTDGGSTWQPADVLLSDFGSGPGSATQIDLAASGNSAYVVWHGRECFGAPQVCIGTTIWCSSTLNAGSSWTRNCVGACGGPPPSGGPNGYGPKVAVSGSNAYVTWWQGYTGPGIDIYFNRSTNNGINWGTETRIDTGDAAYASDSREPRIAAAGSGVYVAWEDRREGSKHIYFNGSTNNGASWFPVAKKLDSGPSAGQPDVAALSGGSSVAVAYDSPEALVFGSPSSKSLRANRSLDGGTTWLAQDVLVSTGDPALAAYKGSVKLAASGSAVYAAWRDLRNDALTPTPGDFEVYFNRSLDSGATWLATDYYLDTGAPPGTGQPSGSAYPNHVIAAVGEQVYTAWIEGRNASSGSFSDVYANIPFGALKYLNGKTGSGGFVPALSGSGLAVLGGTVSANLASGLGGAPGTLSMGFTGRTLVPLFGGLLLVDSPQVFLNFVLGGPVATPGAGGVAKLLAIPADVALLGLRANLQGFVLDPGASFSISMSNGLEFWIG